MPKPPFVPTALQPIPSPQRPPSRRAFLAALPGVLGLGLLGGPSWAQGDLSDLARVRASGVLKVALYRDNAPFVSGVDGELQGLDVALARGLAQRLGLQLSLLPFNADENMNDDLRNMVWRGHYLGYGPADVMLHVPVDRYLMQENKQALIFAPYMRQQLVLLHDIKRLPEVVSADDLKGLPLAAERGTGAAATLMGQAGGQLREQVVIHDSGVAAGQSVADGRAAAAYVTRAQAEAVRAAAGSAAERLGITPLRLGKLPAQGWPLGMAVKAQHLQLAKALEDALKALRESGELLAMFQSRGLTLTAP